ncbi:hypothetical protein HZH68_010350 [Vespula germanica]|uniref:Uncharacterized protein n=1 Tax=Vespula germanica TaxID=30212 RepID=A0A834JSA5_VESGE|nr:hypothetical protein HZH68_010350 [Vespula germanica]
MGEEVLVNVLITHQFYDCKGGHHDDRIEHKREAPEGVTGHKTPHLPSTLASRCRDYPVFPYKTCTSLRP